MLAAPPPPPLPAARPGGPPPPPPPPDQQQQLLLQASQFCGGALAGALGKLVVYPLDTVKKRFQTAALSARAAPAAASSVLRALVLIAREDAAAPGTLGLVPRALFKGLTPSLLKTALSTAITFWAYEAALRALAHARAAEE